MAEPVSANRLLSPPVSPNRLVVSPASPATPPPADGSVAFTLDATPWDAAPWASEAP